eukprot:CAMPEP_0113491154 /NCGR_PEP_ID=MMETSP0014_2-20120614/27411_1 /TAXON_ID=2857 /ORGANISM="Nitzschia sp." /LENGTH=521 /DNA_ID=CAMNT_0000384939 /DNA_START=138 /DNA_END=1700 /DNA_ORIENTATION=+ /assembly_acc=CAM_ASM_000159
MLSAIKTGKKKKKTKKNISESSSSSSSQTQPRTQIRAPPREEPKDDAGVKGGESYISTMAFTTATTSASSSVSGKDINRSAAEELRRLLQSGGGGGEALKNILKKPPPPPPDIAPPPPPPPPTANDATATTNTTTTTTTINEDDDTNNNKVVVLPPTTSYHPSISKSNKREDEMTATELAARERATSSSGGGGRGGGAAADHMSWDEAMTRNIYRVGKKRKMKMKSGGRNYDGDSDEEVEQMKRHLPGRHYQMSSSLSSEPSSSSSSPAIKDLKRQEQQQQKEDERTKRRLVDLYKKEQTITSKCYWWVQSSNFAKQRLVAFGEHVVLMMAPLNSSLAAGHHFYIVPIKHAPSFVECSDAQEVWEEVRKFRQALENVYARERKGIVMTETVLPSRSTTSTASSFWQTKLEVVPVPFSALQDAPLYFKQSMTEQAEEWGTHNKVLSVMNPQRPLSSVIPKGFPYFACDFGNLSTSRTATGYAQIIESSSFSTDFGNDTLASMMELDPIRFERKKSFPKGMEE